MITRHSVLALALAAPMLLTVAAGPGSAPSAAEPGDSVATVNGENITRAEFDVYVAGVERQTGRDIPPEQEAQLLDQLITMRLAAADARKQGVEDQVEVQQQIELARLNVLVDAGLQKWLEANPVSDEQLKPEYDAQVAALPREYHARHILVEDQATAQAIIGELEGGADFAKLAREKSKDSSAQSGGDLGWFTLDSMVKPFADAVSSLEKGAITVTPVQSQFGWHVIRLEDSRAPTPPAFEQVKDQVRAIVQRRMLQEYLDGLRKDAKIEKKI